MAKLAIIGGGKMGEALVAGLLDAGWAEPDEIVVAEIHEERREQLVKTHGVRATGDVAEAVAEASNVLIAVKPQDIDDVLGAMAGVVRPQQLVMSIAAGIQIGLIERKLGGAVPVVRAMPNTAALLREGAAAIAAGTHATPEHMAQADEILSAVCRIVHLPEKYLDAVTGVSGTGPAYVFFLAEALIEAAVGVGLPRDVATELSVQTLLGAARMLRETGKHPVELREEVTSPGGTTVAAMRVLERAGVRSAFLDAVRAATERSRELAEGHG
ncbi:MAG: pyrroline-5-carboxylate reductase [Actinomycetota bacterium]|nr:pyrroline-5-carboxylate reductase [Actinomycetota bacterium]